MKTNLLLAMVLFAGCSENDRIGDQIAGQFARGDSIDLVGVGPPEWDRVCVLGPYSNNDSAASTLGFAWDAEANTSIATSDAMAILVFTEGKRVVAYTGYPRNLGDFSPLSLTCAIRTQAKLVRQTDTNQLAWRTDIDAAPASVTP